MGFEMPTQRGMTIGGIDAAVGGATTGARFGSDLSSAYAYGIKAIGAFQSGKLSQWDYDRQAAAYKEDAASYMATAGDYQQEGLDQAFLRYQQLNEDVGRIRTAAAGSGIDMSSDVVRRVDAQTRQNAAYDVNKIGRNAANKSQSAVYQARNALINSAYATANGKIAYYNGIAQADAYRNQQNLGTKMAWANLVSGTANSALSGVKTAYMFS